MPQAPEVQALYATTRWRKLRLERLRMEPLCRSCAARDIVNDGSIDPRTGERMTGRQAALQVDHVRPHRGDRALFYSLENTQPLCSVCHAAKTARDAEDIRRERKHREEDAERGFSTAVGIDGWPVSADHPVRRGLRD